MRIKLRPCQPISNYVIQETVNFFHFDELWVKRPHLLSDCAITDVVSYTDDARYEISIYQLMWSYHVDAIANRPSRYDAYNQKQASFKRGFVHEGMTVIDITLKFMMDFNFELQHHAYVNYWNDPDIDKIKPLLHVNKKIGIQAFSPIVIRDFARLDQLLVNNLYRVIKQDNKFVLVINGSKQEIDNLTAITNTFVDAVYELVKRITYLGLVEAPEPNKDEFRIV